MLRKKLFLGLLISALMLSGCSQNPQTGSVKPSGQAASASPGSQTATPKGTEAAATETAASPKGSAAEAASETPKVSPSPKASTPSGASAAPGKTFEPVTVANPESLQTKTIGWSWKYSPRDNAALLSKYKGYAFGDTSKKIIYLTFDEGYENGYTASILDTLKANNVNAAFFVTAPFVTGSYNGVKDTELLKRMINEGHLICNHSVQHKSMPSFTDESAFDKELSGVEAAVNSTPGLKISKFFRPPMGEFSELSLYYTQKLGYKSIFFAFAYNDYDVDNQPDPATAKSNILKETQPGMICLLHAVSKTNASILDSLIKDWKSQGYEFKTLNDLP